MYIIYTLQVVDVAFDGPNKDESDINEENDEDQEESGMGDGGEIDG